MDRWIESMSATASESEDGFVKDCDANDSKITRGLPALPYLIYIQSDGRHSCMKACMWM